MKVFLFVVTLITFLPKAELSQNIRKALTKPWFFYDKLVFFMNLLMSQIVPKYRIEMLDHVFNSVELIIKFTLENEKKILKTLILNFLRINKFTIRQKSWDITFCILITMIGVFFDSFLKNDNANFL